MEFGNTEVRIIRSDRKTIAIQIKNGELLVRSPLRVQEDEIYRFLEMKRTWIKKHLSQQNERKNAVSREPTLTRADVEALAQKAVEVLPQKVEYYAQKIGVTYNRITVRCQKTRWGSCSAKGNLNFNCLLMLFPDAVIDSIVVHELCHRKYMNHSPQFYAEVNKVFPEYASCRKWLKENGVYYLNRLSE